MCLKTPVAQSSQVSPQTAPLSYWATQDEWALPTWSAMLPFEKQEAAQQFHCPATLLAREFYNLVIWGGRTLIQELPFTTSETKRNNTRRALWKRQSYEIRKEEQSHKAKHLKHLRKAVCKA